jgi:hypothetical protein
MNNDLKNLVESYKLSFEKKILNHKHFKQDDIMNLFNKNQYDLLLNKQYWHREFGKFYEKYVKIIAKSKLKYNDSPKYKKYDLCDLVIDNFAIDTKYRIGSGDSGTVRKLKFYGEQLIKLNYKPILLIFRDDNLEGTIKSLSKEWNVLTGDNSNKFIIEHLDFDIKKSLNDLR